MLESYELPRVPLAPLPVGVGGAEPVPRAASVPHYFPSMPRLALEVQLDFWRPIKSEAFGNARQVQRVHVERILQLVTVVRQQVSTVGVLGGLVQEVVLFDEFLQLTLHIGQLGRGKLVLVERDFGLFQKLEEP